MLYLCGGAECKDTGGLWVPETNCPLCSVPGASFITKVWFGPHLWLRVRFFCVSSISSIGRLIVSFWASLRAGCKNSMNHGKEGVPHEAKSRCSYSHQYDNRVYTCKVSPRASSCSSSWLLVPLLLERLAWGSFAASQSI